MSTNQVIVRRWALNSDCLTVEKSGTTYSTLVTTKNGAIIVLYSGTYRTAKNTLLQALDDSDIATTTATATPETPTDPVNVVAWLYDLHQAAKSTGQFVFAAELVELARKHKLIQ